jgi:hypothetical protein
MFRAPPPAPHREVRQSQVCARGRAGRRHNDNPGRRGRPAGAPTGATAARPAPGRRADAIGRRGRDGSYSRGAGSINVVFFTLVQVMTVVSLSEQTRYRVTARLECAREYFPVCQSHGRQQPVKRL